MKEKKSFNAVDCAIIILVLLTAIAVVFRPWIIERIENAENLMEYTLAFESEAIPNSYAGYIAAGKSVEWVEKEMEIGEIASIESTVPAEIHTICADGTLLVTESLEESVINGTLVIKAVDDQGCFVSGKEFIGAGSVLTLKSNNTVFTVTVLSVTKS